jgi:hypothetical protein
MQLGLWLGIAAIAAGFAAMVLEKTWIRTAWFCMGLSGALLIFGAHDLAVRPEGLVRAWGPGAAPGIIMFLQASGAILEVVALIWAIKDSAQHLLRRYRKQSARP